MNVSSINNTSFSAGLKAPALSKTVNRSLLKTTKSNLKPLCGPEEVKKAKEWVAIYTAGNSVLAAATAQTGALGSAMLSAVEAKMIAHIFKNIYKFNLSDNSYKILGAAVSAAFVGTKAFDLASKSIFAFIPGIGNAANAIVSGTVTATLGATIIGLAENMDKARKRGESLDKFLEEMEKGNKKP